jgi:hypothetical protein
VHPSVVVIIRENPMKTPRAVEALRIALGLVAGENPLTVVLLDQAPLLLSDEIDDLVDVEILEKHLPVLKELQIPFVIAQGAKTRFPLDPAFNVREASETEIASLIASTHRVLAF